MLRKAAERSPHRTSSAETFCGPDDESPAAVYAAGVRAQSAAYFWVVEPEKKKRKKTKR